MQERQASSENVNYGAFDKYGLSPFLHDDYLVVSIETYGNIMCPNLFGKSTQVGLQQVWRQQIVRVFDHSTRSGD